MSMAPAYVNNIINQEQLIYAQHQDPTLVAPVTVHPTTAFQPPISYPVLLPGQSTTTFSLPLPPTVPFNPQFFSPPPQITLQPPPQPVFCQPTTVAPQPTTLAPQPTALAPQPVFPIVFPSFSSSNSVCPTFSAGSSSHLLTVENPSRTSTANVGRSTRGNSVQRSRTPESNYFHLPQNDRQIKSFNTLGSVPENVMSRPKDPARVDGACSKRRFGYRSKQRKIEQTRSWIKNEFDRQCLFAKERELVRGPDTVRVHVKTYDGLSDIKQALNDVQNDPRIQIARVACPFSKKNKFQKKGYIVYLKVQELSQVPFVFEIFSKYKTLFKNCVVAVPKKDLADALAQGQLAEHVPQLRITQNESAMSPQYILNDIPMQENISSGLVNVAIVAENDGLHNSPFMYNTSTKGLVVHDKKKMSPME